MPQPHILFILTDQQRADCMGCAGHPMLRTPHMDRLAAEGVRFTNCFTTSPLCVPARQSIATGLYPHNSNMWQNDAETPLDADTFMKGLREAGYRTCGIGKHHLLSCKNADLRRHGEKYRAIGFDHVEPTGGMWSNTGCTSIYTDHLERLGLLDPLRRYLLDLEAKPDEVRRYTAEALPIPAEHYPDAFIAARVEQYIDACDSDRPSFVYVGFQGPHEPWDAPDEYTRPYAPDRVPPPIPEWPQGHWLPQISHWYHRWAQYYPPPSREALQAITCRYFGKIAQIDDGLGSILAAYERKGWLERTMVLFSSDHGEMLGDLNRLSKSMCYDSALRVPLILRLPDGRSAGTTREGFVETIDLHATILEAAGCEVSPHKDCKSLLPIIDGRTRTIRDDVLAEVHAHYMLRSNEWKIIIGRDGRTMALFDLVNDWLEQRNLCGHPDHAATEMRMRSRLLGRIAADTYRPGKVDPELSAHGYEETTP